MISYYREFPEECIEEYFGLPLYPFQRVVINQLMHNSHVIEIMCRNVGKTYMTAMAMCAKCVLYAGTQVIVVASCRSQAKESITKIKQLLNDSPTLRAEISEISDSINNPRVVFFNGSTIKIVSNSGDSARGSRCHWLIIDEFAASELEQDFVDSILAPFMGDFRRYGALTLEKYQTPEYEYLKEKPCEIYLSSAGHKSSWTYTRFMDYTKKCMSGIEGYFTCNIQYHTAIECGLRSKQFYLEQMTKDNYNRAKAKCEYEGIWLQSSDEAFYPYESLDNIRVLRKPVYPKEINDFIQDKNKKYLNPKKPDGCLRIMGCDIALRKGTKNDASAYTILQLIPKEKTVTTTESNGEKVKVKVKYYERQLIYIETNNGWLIEKQCERIKKLYKDFDCDRIIVDSKGNGMGLVQELSKPTLDNTTGEDYPAYQCYNDEEMAGWCTYPSPLKTLYCVHATQESNKIMNEGLQKVINNGNMQFLISELRAKDITMLITGFEEFPSSIRTKIEQPYFETRLLIEEMSALELASSTGFKLVEKSGMRKDRFSSLLYANGLADMLEAELNKTKKKRSGFTCKYTPQEYFDR